MSCNDSGNFLKTTFKVGEERFSMQESREKLLKPQLCKASELSVFIETKALHFDCQSSEIISVNGVSLSQKAQFQNTASQAGF